MASRLGCSDQWCQRCKRLDLDDLFRGRWSEPEARNGLAIFDDYAAVSMDPNCAFCEALASIASQDNQVSGSGPPGVGRYCLYSVPSLLAQQPLSRPVMRELGTGQLADQVLGRAKSRRDAAWLLVRRLHASMRPFFLIDAPLSAHRNGCLAESSPTFNGAGLRVRRIDPDNADFGAMREWIDVCIHRHGRFCGGLTRGRTLPRGFSVINCATRILMPLPSGASFAALSYVWGASSSANSSAPVRLTNLPQTIEDAITVTTRLGVGYLWIDRYCIPQHECEEKREQIQNMHDVYGMSYVTIIAAAGNDPSYGLPGISRARNRAPTVDIWMKSSSTSSGRRIVSTGRNVEEAIRGTTWATRAWTFQEGLVSTRKLVFTDEQVYFHCTQREFRETIQEERTLVAETDSSYGDAIGTPFRCELLYSGLAEQPPRLERLFDTLRDFSTRSISFQNDFLNAASGILNLYQQVFPDRMRHVWGQPLRYDAQRTVSEMMASALQWEIGLGARRREVFPSWSWMGWRGTMWSQNLEQEVPPSQVSVQLELRDGRLVDERDAKACMDDPTRFQKLLGLLSRCIIIQTDSVYLHIHDIDPTASVDLANKWEPKFCNKAGTRDFVPKHDPVYFLKVTQKVEAGDELHRELSAGRVWLGLVFAHTHFVLVVRDVGSHYERVGIVQYSAPDDDQKLVDLCQEKRRIRLG
ncbi:Heterokaryon incompatibility [Cordyceps fumosorosea ARSEF 2679]|uniref:Heterokaryon incompatibility n=1 Tax=Cordyceps fumosorosea (strain ARSEF 2679) TaxID=1081104 RepID=A0A167DYJ2_CORFA|nr:Heterokaryon incompatibility [Cordyceps fumosorosea ARSEF 2679]OAA43052.1 Heterokaryon incompatibility [Cordyceps fumosorosea ARSEF 2679]